MNRFRIPEYKKLYQLYVDSFADKNSFLYWRGLPRRGSTCRCAFWDAVNSVPHQYEGFAYVAYRAGEECRNNKQTL